MAEGLAQDLQDQLKVTDSDKKVTKKNSQEKKFPNKWLSLVIESIENYVNSQICYQNGMGLANSLDSIPLMGASIKN